MNKKNLGFATRQIHTGKVSNDAGALCAPIYQTSTFEFETVEQGGARFAGQEAGYIYSRLGNPTVGIVEAKMAELEGGEDALATASGMGAISTAIWSSVEAGDEIVACDTLYGCTYALLNHGICKFGVKVTFIDMTDLEALKAALTSKTKVVYLETPCNPTLKIVDIAAVAQIAHAYNADIKVMVAGCSTSVSASPRETAMTHSSSLFSAAAVAALSALSSMEIMPPGSFICFAAISWPGKLSRPG